MSRSYLALVLAGTLASSVVSAETTSDDGAARAAFERGRRLHDSGKYRQAIAAYQAAYGMAPMPEFLFNIGQCYRLLGERTAAVEYYQRYLAALAQGGASDDARAHIAELATTSERGPWLGVPHQPAERRPSPWRWVGLGTAGAGVVALSASVYFRFEAASAADELAKARGKFDDRLEALDRSRVADTKRMWIFAATGAALVTGGVTTFILAGGKEKTITATPVVSPGGGGVSVSGAF